MENRDIHFASVVISITSILYGAMSSFLLNSSNLYGFFPHSSYQNTYYTPYILLVILGITKIIGLKQQSRPLVKRVSIIGLMFSWGFIWTTSIVDFILIGPNRTSIILIPIIAICMYIALRGDYIDR